jgi:hypothetical protein
MWKEAVVAEFKVVLEKTTKILRLVDVPLPGKILTELFPDTRQEPCRVRSFAPMTCTKPQYMPLKFVAQLLGIVAEVKRVGKWTNIGTTSQLCSLPGGSRMCLNTELAFIST